MLPETMGSLSFAKMLNTSSAKPSLTCAKLISFLMLHTQHALIKNKKFLKHVFNIRFCC